MVLAADIGECDASKQDTVLQECHLSLQPLPDVVSVDYQIRPHDGTVYAERTRGKQFVYEPLDCVFSPE